ncbi:MAG: hypothetical protein JWL99_2841, partial [Streptomyces oryziradicis]|nr:hypothetical protein [Actinacidiphila oryziradicis]
CGPACCRRRDDGPRGHPAVTGSACAGGARYGLRAVCGGCRFRPQTPDGLGFGALRRGAGCAVFGGWVGGASGVTRPQLPPPAFGREVPPGGAPTTVSPAPPAPCAIATGIRRHSLRGHPCTAPSGRHSALRCVFPWGPNPVVRGVGLRSPPRRGRHAPMRPGGDAPGCPRRGRAHAPRARSLPTRTCEPRGDHPTAAPAPTTTSRGGQHDNPARPAFEDGTVAPAEAAEPCWSGRTNPARPALEDSSATPAEGAAPCRPSRANPARPAFEDTAATTADGKGPRRRRPVPHWPAGLAKGGVPQRRLGRSGRGGGRG